MSELIIVGAGPAGLEAAIRASELGVDALVLDESSTPGGQIYRQPLREFQVSDPRTRGATRARGAALLQRAARAGVRIRSETLVWSIDGNLRISVISIDGAEVLQPRRVILAPGAYDRPVPVPGWTLPGVFTVGGAQSLLKSQNLVVGERVLLAGAGPLLLITACQLAETGVGVTVVDAVARRSVLRRIPDLMHEWPLLGEGIWHHFKLLRHRARWLSRHVITGITGDGRAQRATVARVDHAWRRIRDTDRSIDVDAVCLGYGLLPCTELARIAGCEFRYDERAATWLPVLDAELSTTVRGLAVAGDGGGIAGVVAAVEQGRTAAVVAARELGRISASSARRLLAVSRRRRERLNRFRNAMDELYRPRPALSELATLSTVLCRCEEVTAAEIDGALRAGVEDFAALKRATRVGMGTCQGRMCVPAIAERMAAAQSRPMRGLTWPRVRCPARPLPLGWLHDQGGEACASRTD